MEQRISFESKKVRDLFFKKVLESHKLNYWNDLLVKFKIPRQSLDNYRKGRLTLPESIYNKLVSGFTDRPISYFKKNISYFDSNWGRIKGGRITYSKYKYIFDKGREKAITKRREEVHKFDVNLLLNKELAYFIGLFIGDGFTNKYGRYYLTQFVGHITKEKDYYENIISPISKKLFRVMPKIKEELKSNSLRVNFYSKDLFLLITERFKISRGRKSREVLIPGEILKSEPKILLACIAGIYDAEVSVYSDKRKIYKKPYPIIELHMTNPHLIKQISEIFNRQNIKHYVRGSYSRIYIYGDSAIMDFLRKVKFLNPKNVNNLRKIGF